MTLPQHPAATPYSEPPRLLMDERGTGKTTQAMAWVSNGWETRVYPGWSRVLVVPTIQDVDRLKKEYWRRLTDFDHRVYFAAEWESAQGVRDVEVVLDDLDRFIAQGHRIGHFPGRIVGATIYARPWAWDEPFRESPRMVD